VTEAYSIGLRGAQLDVGALLDQAGRATGLSDFGDEWFLRPLGHIVKLVNEGGGLVSAQAWPVQLIVGYLGDRLRMIDYLRRRPEVRDEQLDVAGVIIGLPRGGSTLLQRLLGASPQLTSTRIWEMRFPIPDAGEQPGDFSARIARTQKIIDDMYADWPDMRAIHPMAPTMLDEEILLIERSFLSLTYSHYFNIPDYDAWQAAEDHGKAYEELRLWLKILQYNDPARRGRKWLLKSPHHLLGARLRPMLRAFPDARILMTHRTLESVIASYCSTQATSIRNYSTTFDESEGGPHVIGLFEDSLRDMLRVRAEYPDRDFVDIQYADLIADPLAAFDLVMTRMGLSVTAADRAAAASWMAANGRDTHPRHKYLPEDYGISRADLDRSFGFYKDSFLSRQV